MDAFKASEIERMRLGGNTTWRTFFENHADTKMRGLSWDDATIAERYGGDAGEEYKERLTAKVEGRAYVPGERKPKPTPAPASASASAAASVSSRSTPLGGSRTQSPALAGTTAAAAAAAGASAGGRIKVDERYFARLGAENAARPEHLPPSQGGKYTGFGSSPPPSQAAGSEGLPGLDDLQRDPMAALSKGFGWFTNTVTKTAKTVNSDYIQPTAKQLAESDLAAQARVVSGNVARSAQQGARSAQEGFNRFVEGSGGSGGSGGQYRAVSNTGMDESRRAFWDDFSSIADRPTASAAAPPRKTTVGTMAMGKGSSGVGSGGGPAESGKKDEWEDW